MSHAIFLSVFMRHTLVTLRSIYCISEKNKNNTEQFLFTIHLRGRYRAIPYTHCTHMSLNSSIINISHQSGTFVIIDDPPLTYHNHSTGLTHSLPWGLLLVLHIPWVWTNSDMYLPL
jgi:hypothetical protein